VIFAVLELSLCLVRSFVRSFSQILLPRYLMYGFNHIDRLTKKYSLALIRILLSNNFNFGIHVFYLIKPCSQRTYVRTSRSQGLSLNQLNCVFILLTPLYAMLYPLGVSFLLQASMLKLTLFEASTHTVLLQNIISTEELLSSQAFTLCRRMQNLSHRLNTLLPSLKKTFFNIY